MSFVDQLKSQYDPDGAIEHARKIEYVAGSVTGAVRDACQRVASKGRSVSGYYCLGYDNHELGSIGSAYKYLYGPITDKKFLRYERGIEYFRGSLPTILTSEEVQEIIAMAEKKLQEMGFTHYAVRTEDVSVQLKYGHTEFLHKPKYLSMPGFVFFAEVSW